MAFIDLKAQHQASRALIRRRIQDVLDHGQYLMGPEMVELETRLAAYTGTRHCLALASGNEALVAALLALDIGPGDEVITAAFGSAACLEAIRQVGATAVFADIERATCAIDATLVDARVTPRTRAIMAVSVYGQPADMDVLQAIAHRHGLALVEDAAQSFGASYRDRQSCNLSTLACTSFFPGRPLGCYGDGGALFTNDPALAERVRTLRDRARIHGLHASSCAPMDTLQCAIVLARLEHFDWELGQRRRVAASYDALLCGRLQLVARPRDRSSAIARYAVVLDERKRVYTELRTAGIAAIIHEQGPLEAQAEECPVAQTMAGKVLLLPIGPYLDDTGAWRTGEALLRAAGVPLPARSGTK